MRVCVSIPNASPKLIEFMQEEFPFAEIKMAYSPTFSKKSRRKKKGKKTYVMRIICNHRDFANNFDKFRELGKKFPKAKVRAECFQEGGGSRNTGHAIVVALMTGERPYPVKVQTGKDKKHEIYWIKEGFIIGINWSRKKATPFEGKITYIKVDLKDGLIIKQAADIESDGESIVLKNMIPEVERNKDKLKPAIKAAMEKACCYHCKEPHRW